MADEAKPSADKDIDEAGDTGDNDEEKDEVESQDDTDSESGGSDDGADSDEDDDEDASEDTSKKPPRMVPYTRFKKVNDRKNELERDHLENQAGDKPSAGATYTPEQVQALKTILGVDKIESMLASSELVQRENKELDILAEAIPAAGRAREILRAVGRQSEFANMSYLDIWEHQVKPLVASGSSVSPKKPTSPKGKKGGKPQAGKDDGRASLEARLKKDGAI